MKNRLYKKVAKRQSSTNVNVKEAAKFRRLIAVLSPAKSAPSCLQIIMSYTSLELRIDLKEFLMDWYIQEV